MKTHGESRTSFYYKYRSIKKRCEIVSNKDYYRYGGRGIKCLWKSYEIFKRDMHPSFLIHVKKHGIKNTTLERIDNEKSYSKENCKWATTQDQASNRRTNRYITFKGRKKTIAFWARKIGKSRQALRYRLDKGWDINDIMNRPFNHGIRYDYKK